MKPLSNHLRSDSEKTLRRHQIENRRAGDPRNAFGTAPQVKRSREPHWEVLYTPDDFRRDRIAFSIALVLTLMTLALTNLGILR